MALLRMVALDAEINERRAGLERIKSRVTLDLTAAKDDKGKLILTNDKQRESAVAEYLETSKEFIDAYRELKTFEREREEVRADLECIRIEVKYELLQQEAVNQAEAFRLADAIWHARQAPDAWSPERVREAVGRAPEFFRGGGLHVIEDQEAGSGDEETDCPF
jgi:hypothetical protein